MEQNVRTRRNLTIFLSRLFGVCTFNGEIKFSAPLVVYSSLLSLVNFVLLAIWLLTSKSLEKFELSGILFFIIRLVNSATAAICVFKSFSMPTKMCDAADLFREKRLLFDENHLKTIPCFISVLALIILDTSLDPRHEFVFQLENMVYYVPLTQILCTSLQFSIMINNLSSSFRSTIEELNKDQEINKNIDYYLIAYNRLHDLAKLINKMYSLQILLILIRAHIVSSSGLYYFTIAVLDQYPRPIRFKKLFLSASSVLTQIYFVKLIVEPCDRVKRDAKMFNSILWEKASESDNLMSQRGKISNHFLVKRKVNFDAEGYVSLDNSMLCSMIATITTYMVIFLQFGIKNNNAVNYEDPLLPSFYG